MVGTLKTVFNIVVLVACIILIVSAYLKNQITPGEWAILAAILMTNMIRNGE